jgi:iron-sulfur cluster assembly protein
MTISMTATAIGELRRMATAKGLSAATFRLTIVPGSCEKYTYSIVSIGSIADDDTVSQKEGVTIAISPTDLPHLQQLKLDYGEDLIGGAFRFTNPQAIKTCECGSSFTTSPS